MTTSPALPASATSPASLTTAGSRLAGLRRRIPTVVLFAAVSFSGWTVDYVLVLILNSLTGSALYALVRAHGERLVDDGLRLRRSHRDDADASAVR